MDNDSLIEVQTVVDSFIDQLEIILAMISRPVVQRQLLAVLIILFITWMLPGGIRRWRRWKASPEQAPETERGSGKQRWPRVLYHLLTPGLSLVLLNITIVLFAQEGYPNGLLQDMTNLIWIWLLYRLTLTVLFARFGEAVRPYRDRIVTPIFIYMVLRQIAATVPGSTFVDATLYLGVFSFSLDRLISALIVLYFFIVTAWVVKQIMMHYLPSRLHVEPGVIESFATLTRYTLLSLGFIFFLGMLGLDFTSLAIIAGGLSVGIGIGLQDIVANFVSGLVLLFEQSLRPGDVVELDGLIGQVEKISLRATTVRARTNEELIVPNSNFTNQQVKNLTKSDRLVRLIVPFGVSYKSDPILIRQLATEAGAAHPLVLADPSPLLLFRGYGDSSIDFDLSVSVNQPELTNIIKSDLYYMLWQVFAENDVEIPFPQRDINLGTGWENKATDLRSP